MKTYTLVIFSIISAFLIVSLMRCSEFKSYFEATGYVVDTLDQPIEGASVSLSARGAEGNYSNYSETSSSGYFVISLHLHGDSARASVTKIVKSGYEDFTETEHMFSVFRKDTFVLKPMPR